jgi:hypothetical protein
MEKSGKNAEKLWMNELAFRTKKDRVGLYII